MKKKKGTLLKKLPFANESLEYTCIEDFYETYVSPINVKGFTEKEWKKKFSETFTECKPDENNKDDFTPYIMSEIDEVNNIKEQLEDRKQHSNRRVLEYKRMYAELKSGIYCSKKHKKRDAITTATNKKRLDEFAPIPFYLKDEYRDFCIGIVVLAEAALLYLLISIVFNSNPEIKLMTTVALSGGMLVLSMILAYEMAKLNTSIEYRDRVHIAITGVSLLLAITCYMWLRYVTKDILQLAEDVDTIRVGVAVLLCICPILCSVTAFKLEYYSLTDETIKKRRTFSLKEDEKTCERVIAAIDTPEEFERKEKEHLEAIKYIAHEKRDQEIKFAESVVKLYLMQVIKANPAEITKITK